MIVRSHGIGTKVTWFQFWVKGHKGREILSCVCFICIRKLYVKHTIGLSPFLC